jgi:hypothetical protein
MTRTRAWLKRWRWGLFALIVLGGYWLLPISGRVVIETGEPQREIWPQLTLDPLPPYPEERTAIQITDTQPWTHVSLGVNGRTVPPLEWEQTAQDAWTWTWRLDLFDPDTRTEIVFYHDCDAGCIERGRFLLGEPDVSMPASRLPTKLGVVFGDPDREWHERSGWDVELTYARLAEAEFWGIDDLAWRVHQAADQGLRVLVRVDYDQGQSIPPADEHLALSAYLAYLQRLARDARFKQVYGYVLGSGYNSLEGNALAPEHPVTPEWYARMLNGYGEAPEHTDNAIQLIRAVNPSARVLVGPVRPWNVDQDGVQRHVIDVPWLNYMNTLVAALDASARAKQAAGTALTAPDGFALHVPGWVDAPALNGGMGAQEPHRDLRRDDWGEAQAGFRVYRDWLAVINGYPATRGLPCYITSTNTFAHTESPPAQNYPPGWLAAALAEIRDEPQIQALCWFIDRDRSGSDAWDWFSLAEPSGRVIDAAEELDRLLAE